MGRVRGLEGGSPGLSKGCAGWAWSWGVSCALCQAPTSTRQDVGIGMRGPPGRAARRGATWPRKCGGPARCVPAAAPLRPIAPSPPSPCDHTPPRAASNSQTRACACRPPLDPQPAGPPRQHGVLPHHGQPRLLRHAAGAAAGAPPLARQPRALPARPPAGPHTPPACSRAAAQQCGCDVGEMWRSAGTQRGPTTPRWRRGAGAAAERCDGAVPAHRLARPRNLRRPTPAPYHRLPCR